MTFFYVPSLNFEPSQPKRCIRVRKGEGVELQINEIMVTLWKCGDWGYLFSPGVFSSGGPPGPAGPCESQCRTVARTARGGPARSAIAPRAGNRWDGRRQVERRALSGSTTISRRVRGAGGPATDAEPSERAGCSKGRG